MKQKLACQIEPELRICLPVPTFEELVTADQKIIHTAHTLEGLAALLALEKERKKLAAKNWNGPGRLKSLVNLSDRKTMELILYIFLVVVLAAGAAWHKN